ncbi:hypothetical protein CPC08DRAFT_824159 [Agrocybe pediades]|nr:hypothetical protein CPC08DRAFT_824159 [Agrocybe pediades]
MQFPYALFDNSQFLRTSVLDNNSTSRGRIMDTNTQQPTVIKFNKDDLVKLRPGVKVEGNKFIVNPDSQKRERQEGGCDITCGDDIDKSIQGGLYRIYQVTTIPRGSGATSDHKSNHRYHLEATLSQSVTLFVEGHNPGEKIPHVNLKRPNQKDSNPHSPTFFQRSDIAVLAKPGAFGNAPTMYLGKGDRIKVLSAPLSRSSERPAPNNALDQAYYKFTKLEPKTVNYTWHSDRSVGIEEIERVFVAGSRRRT